MKKSGGQIWREGQAKVTSAMSNKGHTGVTGEAGVSCKAKVVEKEWGREIWMANNSEENYCGKILQINQGYNTSLHFHLEKHETFYIRKGQLQVDLICTIDGVRMTRILNAGDTLEIDIGQPHQLIAYDGDVEFVEISTFHKDSDSKRISR